MAEAESSQVFGAQSGETEPSFQPVVQLTDVVETETGEEREETLFKMRAKLFRFEREAKEWKERGTGDIRLLKHKESGKIRVLMRRDKTLKVCANHNITSDMKLAPNVGSDRSWVWSVAADVSDGEPKAETLAVRFGNTENAQLFKTAFEDAQKANAALPASAAAEPAAPASTSEEVHGDKTKEVEEPTVQTDASGSAVASAAQEESSAAAPSTTDKEDASAIKSSDDVTSSEATGGQSTDAPVAAAAMTAEQQEAHKEEIGDAVSEKKADA
ncbi:hypothetical protein P389DRAFT_186937 [Cystobasidium minutum MCA 4210]|uniref:uncharacterized protein n=1 Tax=Cystobasidium minutum MCA 4210 TaxID=1397322 RepID=UPI0034CEEEF9|eukprot:jgi/Rhomi1/186937/estExt_fgenesh1_pg.C_1_t10184